MNSENATSADNQQERSPGSIIDLLQIPDHIGYYLAGFADGEGSFNISFRPRPDFKTLWKVSACFNVSQKDQVILMLFQKYLQCGTLRARPDDVWYFEVNNLHSIVNNVIPFFRKFYFLSAKKKNDFVVFQQIVDLLLQNQHLTKAGMQQVLELRNKMNGKGKRKFSDEEIMNACGKSSETIRQISIENIGNDIVRSL